MEIIPAIDIIDGKCVRLTHGDFSQMKIYNEHPYEVARAFEDAGLKRLHLVDLDGAQTGMVKNWKVLELLAGKTGLCIDFGGGISSEKAVAIVLECGAKLVTVGSVAARDPGLFKEWLGVYGSDVFFLGADVKDEKITIKGWTEQTAIDIYDFISDYAAEGVSQIFCTDVAKDGALNGPSLELYKNIVARFPALHFVASGGASSVADLEALQSIGCKGAIVGKAIYEGRIGLEELKRFV